MSSFRTPARKRAKLPYPSNSLMARGGDKSEARRPGFQVKASSEQERKEGRPPPGRRETPNLEHSRLEHPLSFFRQGYGQELPLARALHAPPTVAGLVVRLMTVRQQGNLAFTLQNRTLQANLYASKLIGKIKEHGKRSRARLCWGLPRGCLEMSLS